MHVSRKVVTIILLLVLVGIVYRRLEEITDVAVKRGKHELTKFSLTSKQYLKDYFKDILLLVVFNFAHYEHITLLKKLYNGAFPDIIFCGPEESNDFTILQTDMHKGYYSYQCLTKFLQLKNSTIRESSDYTKFSSYINKNYTGYLVMMDDVLLNFWNFVDLNTDHIWEGPKKPIDIGEYHKPSRWYWWTSRWGLQKCMRALNETFNFSVIYSESSSKVTNTDNVSPQYKEVLRTLISNNRRNEIDCYGGRSDVYYVPSIFSQSFMHIANIFRKHEVFMEIAIPTILRMLDSLENFESISGIYLPGRVGTKPVTDSKYLWTHYSDDLHFIHPVKLHYGENSTENYIILETFIQKRINRLL